MHGAGLIGTTLAGRFTIQARIGEGGMGVVYRARDQDSGTDVACKTLSRTSAAGIYRLKQEFRALIDVVHPNLVRLHELFCDDGLWFFTMELVGGVPFNRYVHGDEAKLRDGLRQLATGVAAVHRAGKLHRDLKPPSVLVTHTGRVVILDFGLVRPAPELSEDTTFETGGAGTPAYMAPEQLEPGGATTASDWYAVGVMLYEALCGELPFTGAPVKILMDKRSVAPAPVMGAPDDLAELCASLLKPRAADRPPAAEILAKLGAHEPARAGGSWADDDPSARIIVGRDEELDRLRQAYAASTSGAPTTAYVCGSSGIGKTALIDHFLAELRRTTDAAILSGRCYERESVPYKALDPLIDALAVFLGGLPDAEAAGLVPREVAALCLVFPSLAQVPVIGRSSSGASLPADPLEVRRRAFRALKVLLGRIACRQPLVLFIDDLQWGDLDSAAVLAELFDPPDPPSLLLLGSYRSADAPGSAFLQALLHGPQTDRVRAPVRVDLSPLDVADAITLAHTLLGDEGEPAEAESIAREAKGNPFFVGELIRYASANEHARQKHESTPSLTDVVHARVSTLPAPARSLLELLALATRPTARQVAIDASGLADGGQAAIDLLLSEKLIRATFAGERAALETYHDRIRETVAKKLPAERACALHLRLGLELERAAESPPDVLAEHFHRAGRPEEARKYAELAAKIAEHALAFGRAAELYRLARDLTPPADTEHRRAMARREADALRETGRGPEAADAYLFAADDAPAQEAVELSRLAACELLKTGHVQRGKRVAIDVLRAVGSPLPSSMFGSIMRFYLGYLGLRSSPLEFDARPVHEIPSELITKADVLYSVALATQYVDPMTCAPLLAPMIKSALEAGDPLRIARAAPVVAHMYGAAFGTQHPTTRRLHALGESLCATSDDPLLRAAAKLNAGQLAQYEGRWRRSRDSFGEAAALLGDHGRHTAFEAVTAQLHRLTSMFYLGEMRALAETAHSAWKETLAIGNLVVSTFAVSEWLTAAWLVGDEVDFIEREIEETERRWPQELFLVPQAWLTIGRCLVDLYRGASSAGWHRLSARWPALQKAGPLRVPWGRYIFLPAHAAAALAAATERPSEATKLARIAERDAKAIAALELAGSGARAALIRAGAAAVRGRDDAVAAHLRAAVELFEAADMAAYANVARARLGAVIGGDEGAGLTRQSDVFMAAEGVARPDRFVAMLAPGFRQR